MAVRIPFARSFFFVIALAAVTAPGCSDSHELGGTGGGSGGGTGTGGGAGGGTGTVDAGAPDLSTCGGCMTYCQEITTECDALCDDLAATDCATFCDQSDACDQVCTAADQACELCDAEPPPGSEELCSYCDLLSIPGVCVASCDAECPTGCAQAKPLCEGDLCQQVTTYCETSCPCGDGGV